MIVGAYAIQHIGDYNNPIRGIPMNQRVQWNARGIVTRCIDTRIHGFLDIRGGAFPPVMFVALQTMVAKYIYHESWANLAKHGPPPWNDA